MIRSPGSAMALISDSMRRVAGSKKRRVTVITKRSVVPTSPYSVDFKHRAGHPR